MEFILYVLSKLAIKDDGEYWVGARGNRWSKKKYSREEAFIASESLHNCRECVDCENCSNCVECTDCKHCEYCFRCEKCWTCIHCVFCENQDHLVNEGNIKKGVRYGVSNGAWRGA